MKKVSLVIIMCWYLHVCMIMVGGQQIVIRSKCGEVSKYVVIAVSVIMLCVVLLLSLVTPAVLVTSHGCHSRDK